MNWPTYLYGLHFLSRFSTLNYNVICIFNICIDKKNSVHVDIYVLVTFAVTYVSTT